MADLGGRTVLLPLLCRRMDFRTLVRSRRVLRRLLAVGLAGALGSATLALADEKTLVIRDVPYGEGDGVTLRLDVYRSSDAHRDPVLVLVHGGSWRRRSKDVWSTLAPRYAEAGYVVFAIDYRLAPPGGDARFPEPVDDVVMAVEWAREHAAVYGGHPDRIALAGSSAGAHLALLAAGSDQTRPEAVVVFSPPVKLKGLHRGDILRGPIENFLGCAPDVCPITYRQASGTRAVDEKTPPTLVAFSSGELIPRHQPMELVRELLAAGRPFARLELGGTLHGMPVAERTFEETLGFLDVHLGSRSGDESPPKTSRIQHSPFRDSFIARERRSSKVR